MSYVLPEYQDSCERYPPTYDTELASIECGPEDLPIDYTLFANLADMAEGYNGDLRLGDFPGTPEGKCRDANYEDTYNIDGEDAGRVNCRQHTLASSGALYHVIEWTHDELAGPGLHLESRRLALMGRPVRLLDREVGPVHAVGLHGKTRADCSARARVAVAVRRVRQTVQAQGAGTRAKRAHSDVRERARATATPRMRGITNAT